MTHETAMLLGATAYVALLVGWLAVMASRPDAKPKTFEQTYDWSPSGVNYVSDVYSVSLQYAYSGWMRSLEARAEAEMSRWEDDGGALA